MSYRVTLDNGTILSGLAGSTPVVFLTAHTIAFIKSTIAAQEPDQAAPAIDLGSWDHAILASGGLRFVYSQATRRAPSDPIDRSVIDGGATLDFAVVGVDVLLDDGTTGQWRRGKVLAIGAEESSGDRLLEGYETIYQLRGDSVPAEIPTELQHFAGLGVNGDQWFGPSAGSPTYRTFQTAVGACYGGEYVLVQKEISRGLRDHRVGPVGGGGAPALEAGHRQAVAGGHRRREPLRDGARGRQHRRRREAGPGGGARRVEDAAAAVRRTGRRRPRNPFASRRSRRSCRCSRLAAVE
jgi:hypothetical protein